jgi:hypothetical protein
MAALTSDERSDLQGDLGISANQTVFTDNELDRLYTRADGDYGLTVYYAYRQLLADANKFFDYTAGMTSVRKSQVRDHIKDMLTFWKDEARGSASQVRMVGLVEVPPRTKDEPNA